MLCTERSLVKHGSNTLSVRPLRCKRWSCEHCRGLRKRDLWHKAFKGDPRIFLTLTMQHGPDEDPSAVAEKYVVGWRMLRQYLCRKLGRKTLTFLAVFEKHPKSGFPHLHILLRGGYISRTLIKQWWEKEGYGYIVDIRLAKNPRQRASYVSKYVASDPGGFEHCKRYWCSQDWDPKKVEDASIGEEVAWWETSTMHPLDLYRAALRDGARCTWAGDMLVIERWENRWQQGWGIGMPPKRRYQQQKATDSE